MHCPSHELKLCPPAGTGVAERTALCRVQRVGGCAERFEIYQPMAVRGSYFDPGFSNKLSEIYEVAGKT